MKDKNECSWVWEAFYTEWEVLLQILRNIQMKFHFKWFGGIGNGQCNRQKSSEEKCRDTQNN